MKTFTTIEIIDILYKNLVVENTISVDGRKIIQWIVDNYDLIPKKDLDLSTREIPPPSQPAPPNRIMREFLGMRWDTGKTVPPTPSNGRFQ